MNSVRLRGWTSSVLILAAAAAGAAVYILFLRSEPRVVVQGSPRPEPPVTQEFSTVSPPPVWFVDVTESAGIQFVHTNGSFGQKLLPETMGSGGAFLDYDVDGDQDLLLVNSRTWPEDPEAGRKPAATLVLYQNDGTGRFSDVTDETDLALSLFL